MSIALTTPEAPEQFTAAAYTPAEVSGYLLATNDISPRPPTVRRLSRWIDYGLVALHQQALPLHRMTLDFDDLVTCQAIASLQAVGYDLDVINRTERFFSKHFKLSRPFAHRNFWFDPADVIARDGGLLVSGNRGGQLAMKFVEEWLTPLRQRLDFSTKTGMAVCWWPTEGISLRPGVRFGKPCVDGTRIPTDVLWDYVSSGDPVAFIAKSYGLEVADVERAVEWERRLRSALAPAKRVLA